MGRMSKLIALVLSAALAVPSVSFAQEQIVEDTVIEETSDLVEADLQEDAVEEDMPRDLIEDTGDTPVETAEDGFDIESSSKAYARHYTTEATCTEPAYDVEEVNGAITKTEISPALGHIESEYMQSEPGKPYYKVCTRCHLVLGAMSASVQRHIDATCTEPGYIETETAGAVKRDPIPEEPARGHIWTEWETVQNGDSYDAKRTCGACNMEQLASEIAFSKATTPIICGGGEGKETFFDENGEVITEITIPALEHIPGEYTQDTPGGPYYRKCTRCGEVLEMKSYSVQRHIDATCTEPGYIETETAGAVKRDPIPEEPALGHDFSVLQENSFTDCEKGGYTIFGCSRCSETKKVEISPKAHTWTEWKEIRKNANGTVYRRECSVCHKTEDKTEAVQKQPGTTQNASSSAEKTAQQKTSVSAKQQVKPPIEIKASGLKNGKLTLKKGKSKKLKAVLNGIKGKVKWSSSKKSVVTVSKNGKIKAKKKGTAYITAKVGKKKIRIKVVVSGKKKKKK